MPSQDEVREADLRTLVEEFMRQEHCSQNVALHIIARVTQFLGHRDVAALLERLRRIEAETMAAPGQFAGLGIRRARILRALFDCFAVCLTPAGHAACSAIVTHVVPLGTPTH
jgi:hypothetical protein